MSNEDLQLLLRDIERVADAAEQLLRSAATAPPAASQVRDTSMRAPFRYVRAHPWRTLIAATGVGFLLRGILTRRR